MSADTLAAPGQAAMPSGIARNIVRRAMSGTVWLLTASVGARLVTFGTSIVLARLLGPSDFGLVSFSMVAIGAMSLLQDLGVPAALIYGGQSAREAAGTALTINVVSALLLWVGLILVAPLLATLGGHAEIQGIVVVLGLGLIITSLGSVQTALLTRALAFRKRLIPDVLPLFASGLTSIVLAYSGFGAWSLVWGYVMRAFATAATLWTITDVRFLPAFDWRVARHLLSYGKHVSASAIVGFAVNNVDYLIVGSVLGSYYLGLYTMAFVLGNLLAVVTQALADVAFPTLSLLKSDRAKLLLVFDRGVLAISTVLGFLMLNMLILSPSMIPLLLSDRWASIVEPLMILTVFSAIRSLGILYAPILKALGRPDLVWKFAVIRLLVATPLLYWSATISIIAVGVCQVILVAAYLPLHWVLLRRLSDNAHQPLRLLTPMSLGLGACGVAWAALAESGWLDLVNTRPEVAIAVALAMSVVYWSVIALARPQAVREGYRRLRAWQEQRRGSSSATSAAQTWSA